jgi:hypothetical protein
MPVSAIFSFLWGLLALVGIAALALILMLASPVRDPPPLASIHEGAVRIDASGAPALSRFQARRHMARLSALSRGERRAGQDRDPGARLVRPVDRNE